MWSDCIVICEPCMWQWEMQITFFICSTEKTSESGVCIWTECGHKCSHLCCLLCSLPLKDDNRWALTIWYLCCINFLIDSTYVSGKQGMWILALSSPLKTVWKHLLNCGPQACVVLELDSTILLRQLTLLHWSAGFHAEGALHNPPDWCSSLGALSHFKCFRRELQPFWICGSILWRTSTFKSFLQKCQKKSIYEGRNETAGKEEGA